MRAFRFIRNLFQPMSDQDPYWYQNKDVPVENRNEVVKIFFGGDVMIGRGVDQIMPSSCPPAVLEPYTRDARDYVSVAVEKNGPLPLNRSPDYVWGDLLEECESQKPDARIINLETAITLSNEPWPNKEYTYRAHPDNTSILSAAQISACALANNHTVDFGRDGLQSTIKCLKGAGIQCAGAGANYASAEVPAIINVPNGSRILFFSFALTDSGVPLEWAASNNQSGVWLVNLANAREAMSRASETLAHLRREGDIAVASIHWGPNWSFEVPQHHRSFAWGLIDSGFDIIHGHSSHHVKGIEVYRGRLIMYGCGDLLDDYEGLEGMREYRHELGFMYFATCSKRTGELLGLELLPIRIQFLRVNRAIEKDVDWLDQTINRESSKFGIRFYRNNRGHFQLGF